MENHIKALNVCIDYALLRTARQSFIYLFIFLQWHYDAGASI